MSRPYRHRRPPSRRTEPQRAEAILGRWLRTKKLDKELAPHFIAQRWRDLVGDRVAARARPTTLKSGVLTIEVATSAWLNELSMMRERLLKAVGERIAACAAEIPGGVAPTIEKIRLVVGRPQPTQATPATRAPAPPPHRPAPLPADCPAPPHELNQTIEALEDETLAAAIRRAWTRWRIG